MADPWERLHELAASQIINQIEKVEDVISFERTSQRFRELSKILLTTVSNPTPIVVGVSILTSFPQLQQMNNVIIAIKSVAEAEIAKGLNNLKEGNFVFDDVVELVLFLRFYFRPDEIEGGVTHRTGENLVLRLIHQTDDNVWTIIVIERGRVLWWDRMLDVEDEGKEEIFMSLGLLLPISFSLVYNAEISPRFLLGRKLSLADLDFLVKPRVYQVLLNSEMGLFDPSLPPGSNNPSLKDILHFFRFPLTTRASFPRLMGIFLIIRTRSLTSYGDLSLYGDPYPRHILEEMSITDIPQYNEINALFVGPNPDINDALSIHPPDEIRSQDYRDDESTIERVYQNYITIHRGGMIYLSDGSQVAMDVLPIPIGPGPVEPPLQGPLILPSVSGPLSPLPLPVPIMPTAHITPITPRVISPPGPSSPVPTGPIVPITPTSQFISPPGPSSPTGSIVPITPTSPPGLSPTSLRLSRPLLPHPDLPLTIAPTVSQLPYPIVFPPTTSPTSPISPTSPTISPLSVIPSFSPPRSPRRGDI